MEIALSTGFAGGDLPDPSSFMGRNFDDPDGEVGPAGRGYFAQYGFSGHAHSVIEEQDAMMDIDEQEGPVDPDLADMPNAGSLLKKISQVEKKFSHNNNGQAELSNWKNVTVHDLMMSAAQSETLSDQFQECPINELFPVERTSFLEDYAMSCACLATIIAVMNDHHDLHISSEFIDAAIQSFKKDPSSIQSDEFLKSPAVGAPSHTGE